MKIFNVFSFIWNNSPSSQKSNYIPTPFHLITPRVYILQSYISQITPDVQFRPIFLLTAGEVLVRLGNSDDISSSHSDPGSPTSGRQITRFIINPDLWIFNEYVSLRVRFLVRLCIPSGRSGIPRGGVWRRSCRWRVSVTPHTRSLRRATVVHGVISTILEVTFLSSTV